ncbi:hypothetical protein MJO52_00710 [Microbulbifer variabilis]|uniref:DUF2062 domain-containing protein n=1 Tax=Microbulbifer variabilis TaxID=266805 RepID=A0ABY4VCN2_9GAMM|nr:hypothetical protein [Microbulbifer variabilis]USD21695.1 hypothetical protein MJO52_00710 [Microbulbifer variabilis]
MRHIPSIIAASLIPSIVLLLLAGTLGFSKINSAGPAFILIFSIPISLAHLMIYVPLALIIERYFGLNLFKCMCLGLIVGSLYPGFNDWPYPDGNYIGRVEDTLMSVDVIKAVNGYPTLWGWLIYLTHVLTVGLLFGATSGLGYGLLYRKD